MTSAQEMTREMIEGFVIAAHRGDVAKVKELLEKHPALLNARWNRTNETALEAAAHTGQRDVAEYLLSKEAPLDICTASMLGMTDRVASFLEADLSLANARGAHGISVLFHAAMSGQTDIAELLLAHGGGEGIDGSLHGATRFGHTEMVKWLLAHGAKDVNVLNFEQKTPLRVAIERGYNDIADLIRQHGGVE
ncbi:MAG: ankyrin repeat domain-containing protein [Candidatus Tectomicrobia bacterium]|nr:ankyrin repeat domain-containing protein [Candidatus Tectomicrobia bacterium]